MKKLTFPANVDEQGKLHLNREKFANDLKQFAGKEVTITVAKKVKHRSDNQNAYLWAVVYPCVLQGLIDVGYDLDRNDTESVHDWCKKEFLESRKIGKKDVTNAWGEFISMPASTTRLSTEEFNQYIERIGQFAAEYLSVAIPAPTADWMWPEKEIVSVL